MASNISVVAPVSTSPSVSDEGLLAYLRVDADAETVAEVQGLRAMAEKLAGDLTGRAVLNTRFRLSLPRWPKGRAVELPRSPLVSVASVKYYDAEGTEQTLSADSYIAVTGYEPGILHLKPGHSWPTLGDRPDAVQIEFIAGPGPETEDANPVLRQAVLLLSRHFFSGGTPNLTDTEDGKAAERLLLSQRVSGFIQ